MAWTFPLEICDPGCLKSCLLKFPWPIILPLPCSLILLTLLLGLVKYISPLQERECLSPSCVNSREGPLASLGVDKLGDLLWALSTVGDSLLLCIHGEEGESSCTDCRFWDFASSSLHSWLHLHQLQLCATRESILVNLAKVSNHTCWLIFNYNQVSHVLPSGSDFGMTALKTNGLLI